MKSMSSAQLSNTVTTGKGNIKYKYHQKLVDTSSHLLPACNTPFNQGWSIITQAKILGTDFQPDSYGVLADPLAELVDMSQFLQHAAPGLSERAFFLSTDLLPSLTKWVTETQRMKSGQISTGCSLLIKHQTLYNNAGSGRFNSWVTDDF